MQIQYLCENKQHVDTVSKWIYDEFVHGIRPGISINRVTESFNEREKEKLPISILAMNNRDCIGVASLVVNDLKVRDYTPWLAGLYVDKNYRNNGVGKLLIEEVQNIVWRLGFNKLYLRTEHASEYYRILDWDFIESVIDEYGLETDVFLKILGSELLLSAKDNQNRALI